MGLQVAAWLASAVAQASGRWFGRQGAISFVSAGCGVVGGVAVLGPAASAVRRAPDRHRVVS